MKASATVFSDNVFLVQGIYKILDDHFPSTLTNNMIFIDLDANLKDKPAIKGSEPLVFYITETSVTDGFKYFFNKRAHPGSFIDMCMSVDMIKTIIKKSINGWGALKKKNK